ncbi:sulfite exporter TauE/SafE family protein [Lysobacter sp. A3-1-A15]|uniref:sulfite exporter TauE/SafE family protein n=1 Tax=Novilysobacter viscosus TaxID=3098602 RepID=UPI002ED96F27
MPIDWLTLMAAASAGALGGLHCIAMCGGIATGLSSVGGGGLAAAVQSNLGRVAGYSAAGAIAGGVGHGIVAVAQLEWLGPALRFLLGMVMVAIGWRLWSERRLRLGTVRPGVALWNRLRPLQRALMPADRAWKRIGLGALWGWMPCGLSGAVLAAAWLQADARNGALTMAAFGLGTLPLMVPLAWTGARALQGRHAATTRRAGGALVMGVGLVTMAAPWLGALPVIGPALHALGCIPGG